MRVASKTETGSASEASRPLEAHAAEVARLAGLTASALGLPAEEISRIQLAALLHDVGKTAIPESLLDKPGPLDPAEWSLIRTHTLIGERIVLSAPSLAHVSDLVRSSHERVDGGGYPDGLSGHEIPQGARVIAVCDAFDAMTSCRPYRTTVSPLRALTELRRAAGSQFDPLIVKAFNAWMLSARASVARAV